MARPRVLDRRRGAAWAVSVVTLVLVGLGAAASGGPPVRPDPQLTPGATLEVTTADLCVPGYTKKVRAVPAAVTRQVYAAYGIRDHAPGEYEIDHLIPLELGGSNAIKNLWPQSFRTEPWNAHVNDRLENQLHRLVCAGQLPLDTAQRDLATDGIAAYQAYFHTERPLAQTPTRSHTNLATASFTWVRNEASSQMVVERYDRGPSLCYKSPVLVPHTGGQRGCRPRTSSNSSCALSTRSSGAMKWSAP